MHVPTNGMAPICQCKQYRVHVTTYVESLTKHSRLCHLSQSVIIPGVRLFGPGLPSSYQHSDKRSPGTASRSNSLVNLNPPGIASISDRVFLSIENASDLKSL